MSELKIYNLPLRKGLKYHEDVTSMIMTKVVHNKSFGNGKSATSVSIVMLSTRNKKMKTFLLTRYALIKFSPFSRS